MLDTTNQKDSIEVKDDAALYNTRITRVYLEYLRKFYPEIDIDFILDYAGMTKYEVEDPAHWFSQNQVDRFQEILIKKTGNPNIAREAGRHAVSSEALGAGKQYALGLMSLTSVYLLIEKLYPIMSRAATIKVKRLGADKVEIVSAPKQGVNEKPYQCGYRIGNFESLAKLFTKTLANVEHPSCFHKGADCCRYIITWEKTPSLIWKRIRNYSLLLSMLVSLALFFVLQIIPWVTLVSLCVFFTVTLSFYSEHLENKELAQTIKTQGDAAKDLLDEINIRYNNALLVQEIGQATSRILDTDELISTVVNVMEKRLDFDRGMIMLTNKEKTRLVFKVGYGYNADSEKLLQETEFHLDNPESKGVLVLTFKEQKASLVNDVSEIAKNFSKRSQGFAKQMGIQSLICVPIVYEKEALGILAVDNVGSKRPLTQSDMNLLMGVASQTAVGITDALSFQKLQESERKYRELVENANSIISRIDTKGNITFFNEFAQKFFGYNEHELLGESVIGSIVPRTESAMQGLDRLIKAFQRDPERHITTENEAVLKNGTQVWIAWTYKPIFDSDGNYSEILCIGNDVTEVKRAEEEKKVLEAQLQRAQKLEAIGTLAGGISHDFNNILQAMLGYTQILLMGKEPSDPDYNKLEAIEQSAQRASDLTKRLLIFSRKVESKLKPMNLSQEVVQIAKMLERTIPKMISIDLDLAENLKVINADPVQIEQIIMNLGVNARDAMPDGGKLIFEAKNVTLEEEYCKTHLEATPGEYVVLSVSDTGHGMDRYTQEHIFEPFFTTKETGKGTGLGLAMVYGIVKSHAGYITCYSEPNQGTTFKIYFPVIEREAEALEVKEEKVPVKGGSESILIVDDEEAILNLGKEILTRVGYTVHTAPDGETALEFYKKEHEQVDLIILDLSMPGMGGRRCLEELLKVNPQAKVVIASGYSVDESTKEIIDAGSKGFIGKPYEMRQMLEVVRETLDGEH